MLELLRTLKIGDRIVFKRRHLPNYVEVYKGVINSYFDWSFGSYQVKLDNGDIMEYFISGDVLMEVNGNEIN